MTKHLQDVLADIASDAGPVDLLDRVRGETRALRWRRRAVVGAGALGVAGAVALGAMLVDPVTDAPTDPADTPAPVSPLPAQLDLTTAVSGGVDAAALVIVSDGVLYAVEAATYEVVRIETEGPVSGDPQLSADGSGVLLQNYPMANPMQPPVEVIDLATGATVFAEQREPRSFADRFALSPDGERLAAARYETDSFGNVIGAPGVELIDLGSSATTRVDYTPVAERTSDLDPLGGLSWSPDGSHLALSYLNGQDIIEIPAGELVAAETASSRLLIANPWSADSSRLLKESGSAVSTWPVGGSDSMGGPIGSSRLVGEPLGFAGPDLLLWLVDGDQLVVTTLDGEAVGVPTTIVSDAPVDTVASALATAAD